MGDPSKYTRRRQEQFAQEADARRRDDSWVPAMAAWHFSFLYFAAWPFLLLASLVNGWSHREPR